MFMDAATLAHLTTETWKALVDILEGQHGNLTFAPPPWLAQDRWEGAYRQLRGLVQR